MATVIVSFKTKTKNDKVEFWINNVAQGVDDKHSDLILNMASGFQYGMTTKVSTKDDNTAGGDWCETTVTQNGAQIGVITKLGNTISTGQSSDKAHSVFAVN